MAWLAQSSEPAPQNPVDSLEQIVSANECPFERIGEDEIAFGVAGTHAQYQLWFGWHAASRALEKSQLRRMNRYLTSRHGAVDDLVFGSSPAMRELAGQVAVIAGSDRTTALIVGPRGVGKGRVADLVHARGPRAGRPFIEVNCAALTAESLETELFVSLTRMPRSRASTSASWLASAMTRGSSWRLLSTSPRATKS